MPQPIINRHVHKIELGVPQTFYLDVKDVAEHPHSTVKLNYARGTLPASKDLKWSEPPTVKFVNGIMEITSTPSVVRPPEGCFAEFDGGGDGSLTIVVTNPPDCSVPTTTVSSPAIPLIYT